MDFIRGLLGEVGTFFAIFGFTIMAASKEIWIVPNWLIVTLVSWWVVHSVWLWTIGFAWWLLIWLFLPTVVGYLFFKWTSTKTAY